MPGTSCAEGGVIYIEGEVGGRKEKRKGVSQEGAGGSNMKLNGMYILLFLPITLPNVSMSSAAQLWAEGEGWDPVCSASRHALSHQHPLSSQAQQAGLRTRTLPMGDAPQRCMGKVWQLCYQLRGSQAPAPWSSSCHIPHGCCVKEPVCQGGQQARLLEHPFTVCIPLPSHGDGPAGSPWLYSLLPSLA